MKRAIALLLFILAHIALLTTGIKRDLHTSPSTRHTKSVGNTQAKHTPPRTATSPRTPTLHNDTPVDTDTLRAFQHTDFYRTIVQNNLFHPLGTRSAPHASQYRLLGTTTPPDGSIGGTAFVQHTDATDNKTFIAVTLGKRLGDATVVDIQPKQITLDAAGHQTTLKLQYPLWLKK